MKASRGERLALVGLLVAGAAARLVLLAALDPLTWVEGSDATYYLERGWLLAHGQGPLLASVSPGYTWLVAAAFTLWPGAPPPESHLAGGPGIVGVLTTIRLLQVACSLGMVVAATALAARWSGNSRAALVTCSGLALGPAFVLEPFRVLSETLFLGLLFTALLLRAVSRRSGPGVHAGMGALFGLAALVRPVAAGLPLVLGVPGWRRGGPSRRRAAMVFLLAYLGVLAPWSVSLRVRTGAWVPPGLLSNLWIGAVGDGRWHGNDAADELRSRFANGPEDYLGEAARAIRSGPLRWLRVRAANLGSALAQPHAAADVPGPSSKQALASWWRRGRDPTALLTLLTSPAEAAKIALYAAHWMALLAGVAGLLRWRRQWRELAPLWLVIVYFPLVHVFLTAVPRYLFPIQPALWVAAALLVAPPPGDTASPPQRPESSG